MIEALLVSNLMLWFAVVALACVLVALTRQIGLLHERIAPVGVLAVQRGPEVGDAAPKMELDSLSGGVLSVGGADASGRQTLLFFLSPTCPVCKTLLPTLARIAHESSDSLRIVHASDGEPKEHRGFAAAYGLDPDEYALSTDLGMHYQVAKLPFAVLIDAEGNIRAKGIVNTREHVESLFEADRLGVGSLQQYLEREQQASGLELSQ